MCASDDRYADDVHYVGGCVLAVDMLPWAATMLTGNALPPDPAAVGDGWRETWLERHRAHAAVRRGLAGPPAPRRLLAPGLRLRGLRRDRGARLRGRRLGRRLLATRSRGSSRACPGRARGSSGRGRTPSRRTASPAPTIGFLQECLRWFDQHLKGIETGIMDEPRLRALDAGAGGARRRTTPQRPGRWVSEPRGRRRRGGVDLGLRPRAAGRASQRRVDRHRRRRLVRRTAARATGPATSAPRTSARSTFTSEPLDEPIEILGFPEVDARRSRSTARARFVAVRLCDVAPDGASLLVTRGVLNLNHRDGHARQRAARARPPLRGHGPPRRDRPARPRRPPAARRAVDRVLALGLARRRAGHAHPARRAGCAPRPAPPRDERLPDFGPPEWSAPLAGRDDRARRHDAHARPTTRPPARTSCASSGTSAAIAASSTAASRWTTPTSRPTASSTATRCRPACACSAARRSAAARGARAWRPTAEMTATAAEFLVHHRLDAYEGDRRISLALVDAARSRATEARRPPTPGRRRSDPRWAAAARRARARPRPSRAAPTPPARGPRRPPRRRAP